MALQRKTFDQVIDTFERAGDATYVDSAGLLRTASDDIPRHAYDPATSESLGTLIEESRENELINSRDLTAGSWTTIGSPTTAKDAVGIDGVANSACTLTDTNAAVREGKRREITIPDDSNTHASSCFFKKTTATTNYPAIGVQLFGGTTVTSQWLVDTDNGTLVGRNTNSGTIDSYVEDWGDFWRVVAIATNNGSGNTGLRYDIFPAVNTDGSSVWDNTSIGSVVYDYGQIELDTDFASSPIENAGTTTTRPADVATGTIGSELNSSSFGLFVSARTGYDQDCVVYQIDDDTEDERVRIARVSGNITVIVTAGGVEQANIDLGAVADNTAFTVSIGLEEDSLGASLDGGTIITDSSVTMPSGIDVRRVGQDTTGSYWNSTVKRVALYPTRGTNAEIVARDGA